MAGDDIGRAREFLERLNAWEPPPYVCKACGLGVLVLADGTKVRGCEHATSTVVMNMAVRMAGRSAMVTG